MTVSRREMLIAGAALPVAGLWINTARGQNPRMSTDRNVAAGMSQDPPLAAKLLIFGRTQITNSQIAVRQAETGDVRVFARDEVAEQQSVATWLTERGFEYPTVTPLPAPIGGAPPVDAIPGVPGNPPSEPTANRPIVPQPGTRPAKNATPPVESAVTPPPIASPRAGSPVVNVGRMTLPASESRMLTIEMELGDVHIATFQREIAPLTGLAFDKAYIENQTVRALRASRHVERVPPSRLVDTRSGAGRGCHGRRAARRHAEGADRAAPLIAPLAA